MNSKPEKHDKERTRLRRFVLLAVMVVLAAIGCDGKAPPVEKTSESSTTEAAFDGTIVAVGDSLTAGLGVAEEMAYPARLERKLRAAGYAYRVINAGISGETSSGALSRIEWVVGSLNPDIVILETGANDGLRGVDPSLLETNLDRICQYLKENDILVVLAGMQMLPNLGPDYTRAFSDIYPRIARKHQLVFMPFILKDVAGDPGLNQSDRIHPTAGGYARIADNLYPYVLQAIERQRKAGGGSF